MYIWHQIKLAHKLYVEGGKDGDKEGWMKRTSASKESWGEKGDDGKGAQ